MKPACNPLNTGRPLLLAHRGTSVLAPENTFTAFDLGLASQADVLEIDIRISRDQEVIVIHDARVDRTTDGSGKVLDYPLTRLKKLDAGYRHRNPDGQIFRGNRLRLPTLLELYEAYPDVIVNIDIKDKTFSAARLLIKVIERAGAEQRTVVASFHGRVLKYFRQIAPHIATSATFMEVSRLYFSALNVDRSKVRRPAVALQIPRHYKGLRLDSQKFIDKIHTNGLLANFWTVNDEDNIRQLLNRGADGIVTDRPDLALTVFREMGFIR